MKVSVFDPTQVRAFGDGLKRGAKGEEASFIVQGVENGQDVTATIESKS